MSTLFENWAGFSEVKMKSHNNKCNKINYFVRINILFVSSHRKEINLNYSKLLRILFLKNMKSLGSREI